MAMTTEEFEKFCLALLDAFDDKTLEQMLQLKLGKDLFKIVARDALDQVVVKLVRRAEREGWTKALVGGAYLTRSNNPKILEFCRSHAPYVFQPREVEELVSTVQEGVVAITELVRDQGDPTALRIIVRSFGSDFETSQAKFEMLSKYKKLHDCLHFVLFQYLDPVTDAVTRFRQDEREYRQLRRYAIQLRGLVEVAREDLIGLPSQRIEEDWTDKFGRAIDDIDLSLDGTDDAPIGRAVVELKAILQNAPRINQALALMAGELPLPQLIESMKQIDEHLAGPAAERGASVVAPLQAGLADLLLLQPRLAGLVREHHEWQWLDGTLQASGDMTGRSALEKVPRWPLVRDSLRSLCSMAPTKDWAQQLSLLTDSLDASGPDAEPIQFSRTFDRFRDVATRRFFDVDAELRDLSAKLLAIARPLGLLIEVIAHENR